MNKLAENCGFVQLMILVVGLAAVGQITNTIYVPAMDMIARHFHVLATRVQNVMALYLLPYGLSQFIYGPLSDRFGRKPIILCGLAIFIAGSLLTSLATSFELLLIGSFIQGLGIGCGGVMARTVMRDLYHGQQLHKAASYISVALIVAPLAAPLLGGVLSHFWGWRANFIFLLIFACAVLAAEWLLFPETNQFAGQHKLSIQSLKTNYKIILSNPQFLGYMSCLIVTFAGVCIFEAVGGILFNKVLHFTPLATSLWFTVPLPAYMLGCYFSGFFTRHWQLNQILLFGILLLVIGGTLMLATGLLNWVNIYAIIIPIVIYMFAAGILFPAATTGALEPFPKLAGTAGAILGGMQNLGAGACIFISALIPQKNQLPLGMILFMMSIAVAAIFFCCLWQRQTKQDLPETII